ncbi:MAG: hypothetical protein JSS53_04595 [Proteobacteria bacterium]|nr:hypothetical protein [Pseudomonadota bacterium]
MNKIDAIKTLKLWDKQSKYVFTKHDLEKLFPNDSPKTLTEGLNRLVKDSILQRVCRGIYVNRDAQSFDSHIIEHIAKALRRGKYNYLSLESALSEYGVISQILMDRITVVTTGRKGIYKTPYGTIEFTHTKRSVADIVNHIQTIKDHPLRIASKDIAWRDLKRVGRNTNLVNQEELHSE